MSLPLDSEVMVTMVGVRLLVVARVVVYREKGRMEEILREPGNFREGRSLGGNTLEDGAMGHGTPVTSVSLLELLYHRRSGLVLKCRVDDTIQSCTRVLKNKVLTKFRIPYEITCGLCQHTSSLLSLCLAFNLRVSHLAGT